MKRTFWRAALVFALAGASGATAWLAGLGAPYHSVAAACTATTHDGFTTTNSTDLTLGGSNPGTTITGGALRLTSSLNNQLGTAWSTSQVSLLGDASFSTSFTLKFSNPSAFGPGADGMVFGVQTQSNSAGSAGGGLGIGGVTPSTAVEFDDFQNTNDPDNHHMAIDLNGNVDHGGVPASRIFSTTTNFFTQGTWYVWVDYNGATTTLEARIAAASGAVANIPPTSSRPASAQVSIVDDLATRLGQTTAFVGFTAATGGANGTHEVLGWRFYQCFNPNPDGTAQSITFAALSGRTIAQTPFTVNATASSGLAVSFSSATTSVCTVSGATITLVAVGTCSIIASQPGDNTFTAADPVTRSFTVSNKASQSITFAALAGQRIDASPITVSATASSGLAVSFASATASVCTVSGTTVTLVAVGTCTLTASQAGDSTYATASDVSRSFTVSPVPIATLITFGPLRDRTLLEQPFTVSATSSGLAVSFASSTAGVCTVSGTTVTLLAMGTCTITASAPGSPGGYPFTAASASQSFAVTRAPQSIAFAAPSDRAIDAAPFTVSATASSGLAVSFASSTAGVCTVSGTTVTLLAMGTCTITASQAGDSTYAAAAAVTRSFAVSRVPQTIDAIGGIDLVADHVVGETPATLSASASSGLAVSVSATGACTLKDSALTFSTEGDCTLTASQAGNATYLPAASRAFTFKVKVLRSPVAVVLPVAPGGAPTPTRQSACGPIPAPDVATYVGLPGYHSAWAGESAFLVGGPGQPLDYCLVLRNTGTLPWVSGARSTQINLGANTPQDSTAYVDQGLIVSELYDRNRFSTAQEDLVRPGDYATFVIRVRAPAATGITRVDVAPVIDGVQWLEDEGIYFLVAVR